MDQMKRKEKDKNMMVTIWRTAKCDEDSDSLASNLWLKSTILVLRNIKFLRPV